jgi:hypothetical protein
MRSLSDISATYSGVMIIYGIINILEICTVLVGTLCADGKTIDDWAKSYFASGFMETANELGREILYWEKS